MRTLFYIFIFFTAHNAYSCIEYSSKKQLCIDETVYYYAFTAGHTDIVSRGKVIGINETQRTVLIEDNHVDPGLKYTRNVVDVSISIEKPRSTYNPHYSLVVGTVVGMNSHRNTLIVEYSKGYFYIQSPLDLDTTTGCIYGVCVNDSVYNDNFNKKGAIVVGINFQYRRVTVRSNNDGKLYIEELPQSLKIANKNGSYTQAERNKSMKLNP